MRAATSRLSIAALAAVIACGGGGGGDSTGPSPTATTVTRVAGDSQVAPAGSTLPESLAVLVTDSAGHPVANVTVNWSVVGVGGSVSPATSHTDALGIAKAARTLGTIAGHGKTNAAVTGLTLQVFEAVGQVQGAVTISSSAAGPFADTVLATLTGADPRPSVKVVDQDNHPVAGVNVVWSATGGGSVTTATVPTDTAGISTVEYKFGATRSTGYQAHATVTGLINSPINFALTANAGVPVTLEESAGNNALASPGTTVGLSVRVLDGHANTVPGVRIDWDATSGGGSVAKPVDSTDASGIALVTRTLGAASGEQTTTATATTLPGTPSVVFSTIAAHFVKVSNNVFNPNTITIAAGDSVAWVWQGITVAHNITFAALPHVPPNEPDRVSGTVFRVFVNSGTYTYQCTNHPGMTGSVTVTP